MKLCWLFGHEWVVESNKDSVACCMKCGLIGSLKYLSMSGIRFSDITNLKLRKDI